VVAALGRDLECAAWWGAGTGRRRQHLEIVQGRGERVHATAAANRESIYRHGLDWNRMGLAPGLAGSTRPELPAIFVCEDLDDVSFLLRMAQVPIDIWSVDVDGIWLENGPSGWQVISHPVAEERLTLLVRDMPVGGFRTRQPHLRASTRPPVRRTGRQLAWSSGRPRAGTRPRLPCASASASRLQRHFGPL
jgi:hypothetical protein